MSGATKGVAASRAQSYSSLEKSAAAVRRRLLPGRSDLEPVPGLELFERLDEYRVTAGNLSLPLQYGVEILPAGLEAHARYSTEERAIIVVLSETTYADLRIGTGRALFTLAHEIGHAVLHPTELVERRLASMDAGALHRGLGSGHKAFLDTEWQANGFAAAILMPATGLLQLERRGALHAGVLSSVFRVSVQAAELRLKVFAERRRDLLGLAA